MKKITATLCLISFLNISACSQIQQRNEFDYARFEKAFKPYKGDGGSLMDGGAGSNKIYTATHDSLMVLKFGSGEDVVFIRNAKNDVYKKNAHKTVATNFSPANDVIVLNGFYNDWDTTKKNFYQHNADAILFLDDTTIIAFKLLRISDFTDKSFLYNYDDSQD